MNYYENVLLKEYTTLKIGGPAKRFYEPETVLEISQIVKEHKENNWPLVVLGNGSNMLFEDEGYDGSVLHVSKALNQIEFIDDTTIRAFAGVENGELALWLAGHELGGFEFASGIPGTIGGAVIMNAGAYNGEMVDVLSGVGYIDEDGLLQYATADQLELGYRHILVYRSLWSCRVCGFKITQNNTQRSRRKALGSLFETPRQTTNGKSISGINIQTSSKWLCLSDDSRMWLTRFCGWRCNGVDKTCWLFD